MARVWDVDHISERLAVRNTTLGNADGTIVPSSFVGEHAMVVKRTRVVKIVGCVHHQRVISADGNGRRTGDLHKKWKIKAKEKN